MPFVSCFLCLCVFFTARGVWDQIFHTLFDFFHSQMSKTFFQTFRHSSRDQLETRHIVFICCCCFLPLLSMISSSVSVTLRRWHHNRSGLRRRPGFRPRACVGLASPAPHSRSVAEEKGGGPGADSVSADSAEGGQGQGGWWGAPARGAAPKPTLFWHFGKGKRRKWIDPIWAGSGDAGEYSNICFCRAIGKICACSTDQGEKKQSFSSVSFNGGTILITIWPPVVENRSEARLSKSSFLPPPVCLNFQNYTTSLCPDVTSFDLQEFYIKKIDQNIKRTRPLSIYSFEVSRCAQMDETRSLNMTRVINIPVRLSTVAANNLRVTLFMIYCIISFP